MATLRKFAIDTYFSPSGEILSDGPEEEPTISLSAHEAALHEAYERGRRDELVRAEEALAAEVRALSAAVSAVSGQWRNDLAGIESAAGVLALATARAVAGAALARFEEARVLEVLDASLHAIVDPPRLVLRMPASSADRGAALVQESLESAGLAAVAQVRADPRLGVGQAIIEWPEGAITLDASSHLNRIEHIVQERLAQSAEPGAGE